ncbi:MAG: Cation-transporting P-ATPase PacL, partial [candidate division CPR2 bacterium GW2011_GWD2_39_7]
MSYLKPIDEVLKEYKTTEAGLSSNEARNRLIKFGPNKIENKKKHSALKNFFLQFVDFLAVMLLIASTLSFILGSLIDGFVILGIVILNATISFFQEYKA